MSINDPLGDMLARIRNAQLRHKAKVTTPASKLRERVLDVLSEEGYIRPAGASIPRSRICRPSPTVLA